MADFSDGSTTFRNVYEERANQIAMKFQTDGRMGQSQSFDYSVPGKLTVTCFETNGGLPFVFEVSSKSSEAEVARDLSKAISAYDRGK